MADQATIGLIGGIIGGVAGLVGGMVGTWFSIKNTNGPRERAFMVRVCRMSWLLLLLFLALLLLLPMPYSMLLWIPYGILLPVAVVRCNRRQQQIRREEAPPPKAEAG